MQTNGAFQRSIWVHVDRALNTIGSHFAELLVQGFAFPFGCHFDHVKVFAAAPGELGQFFGDIVGVFPIKTFVI